MTVGSPLLLPQHGSHVTPSCVISGVLMEMGASVELVSLGSSVHMLEIALSTTVMILMGEVVAVECSGVSGISLSILCKV